MARVLVVDDEGPIRDLLLSALSAAGLEVRTAADALEAMGLLTAEHFDAVLTDAQMPGMDGHEFIRWVKRNRPETRCALMTAYDMECDDCPVQPRCNVLRKPFRLKEALAFIERELGPRDH